MPSEERVALALEALQGPLSSFRATLGATTDEVRRYLQGCDSGREGKIAGAAAELGPLGAGRIDIERFAAMCAEDRGADPLSVAAVRRALETFGELAARTESLCRAEVPPGGSLLATVADALAEIGRAFEAARIIQDARAGRVGAGRESRAPGPLPFSRWTRIERRLALPLVVTVQGSDLRPAGLAEFLDGRQRFVLVVEGECPPAPLVRLVAPGTFVAQTGDRPALDRLAAWQGPGIAALVPEGAARFVHDPAAGSQPWDRVTVEFLPETAPRRAIGGMSATQQQEELALLRNLASRPPAAAPGPELVPAGAAAEPADKLAAWLLNQVDLSDLG